MGFAPWNGQRRGSCRHAFGGGHAGRVRTLLHCGVGNHTTFTWTCDILKRNADLNPECGAARRALQGGQPCYVQLDMRKPEDAGTSASVYKGGRRQRLVVRCRHLPGAVGFLQPV